MKFLDHYNDELRHLREAGARFAKDHPQVAAELGLQPDSGSDPFIERLLEGVAWLTARVQSRMEREGVEFAQQAMARVAPLFQSATPSLSVLALHPDLSSPEAFRAQTIARASTVAAQLPGRAQPVQWSTARPVTLWPLRLRQAECARSLSDIPATLGQALHSAQAVLRLRFSLEGAARLGQLQQTGAEPLHLMLCGDAPRAFSLHRAVLADTREWFAVVSGAHGEQLVALPRNSLRMAGLEDCESLLPVEMGALPGLRLLREYFAQPARFLGIEMDVLQRLAALAPAARAFDLVFALDRVPLKLLGDVDASQFRLFATPVINLYDKRLDPVPYDPRKTAQWIPVDRLRPSAYHLWSLKELHISRKDHQLLAARPALESSGYLGAATVARYSLQREPGATATGERRDRVDPLDSHDCVSIALTPSSMGLDDINSLLCKGLVADRGWRTQGLLDAVFQLNEARAVQRIECLWPASQPRAIPEPLASWAAVSHLGQNPLSLQRPQRQEVTDRLLQGIALASAADNANDRQRLESLRSGYLSGGFAKAARTNPIAWVRSTRLELDISEAHHPDEGAWLFGRVLAHALAESVALNDALEVTLKLNGETVSQHSNTSNLQGRLQ
jgi:type VI secretion system protein ImpG